MPTASEKLAEEIVQQRRVLLWIGAGNSCSAGIPADSPGESGLAFRLAVNHYGTPELARAQFEGELRLADLATKLSQDRIRDLILQQGWDDLELQPAHKAVAALVEEGLDVEIVTINFDRLAERALRASRIDPMIVCSHNTVAALRLGKLVVVKLHGCPYEDPDASHLLFRQADLTHPPDWVLNFLRGRLQEKIFVYVGFSGNAPYVQASLNAVVRALEEHPGKSYAIDIIGSGEVFGGHNELGNFLTLSNVPQDNYCSDGSDVFFADTANWVFRRIAIEALHEGAAQAQQRRNIDSRDLESIVTGLSYEALRNIARRLEYLFSTDTERLSLRKARLPRLFMWMLIFVADRILEDASYRPVLASPLDLDQIAAHRLPSCSSTVAAGMLPSVLTISKTSAVRLCFEVRSNCSPNLGGMQSY